MSDRKVLVAFFSATGVTAKIAEKLSVTVGGDLFEIVPTEPYSDDELNWHDVQSRSSLEMNDPTSRPGIAGVVDDMEGYGSVFIGFPIWWYVAPRIIQTFLESYDFSGKKVFLFATSGMSGMGDTEKVLRSSCPDTTIWGVGKRFSSSASTQEIERWVGGLDF